MINITTRTTIVSNVQLDNNIRIWLLKEEGFKSAPEAWKCRRQNNVFGQSIPDPRSRNVEGPTVDIGHCRQSDHRHHQATGAGRAECLPTVQICYSVEWSKVPWRCVVQNLVRQYGDLCYVLCQFIRLLKATVTRCHGPQHTRYVFSSQRNCKRISSEWHILATMSDWWPCVQVLVISHVSSGHCMEWMLCTSLLQVCGCQMWNISCNMALCGVCFKQHVSWIMCDS